ncbi:MAG TPA: Rid family detoxifying hydrolase [Flavobacteriales bacterium]
MKKVINAPGAAAPIAPYSPAIECNGIIYLSGQIALVGDTGTLRTEDITVETTQVMENIGLLLKAAGVGFDAVVKCTILLSDMAHYADVNAVYAKYFTDAPPAREAYAVKGLPRGVNVEISAIAHRG